MPRQATATGPKYRQIAKDLLAAIESGEYPPGSRLPTKAELMVQYKVAINTVERAIEDLRKAGVVETVQGAGMFVRERQAATEQQSPDAASRLEELKTEVAALREDLSVLQAQVMNLYHSTGQPYPGDATAEPGRRAG